MEAAMSWPFNNDKFEVSTTGLLGQVIGSTNNHGHAEEAARAATAISPGVVRVTNTHTGKKEDFWQGVPCPSFLRPR